ncbi:PADRE domain [Dillenia turbinata]|uniref:PADRE domain n=1 Tax=Dillenia turbinata TaxID=194707 RepID=A0AAN8V6B8_9MAGN
MGNYMSCTLPILPAIKNSKAARVILPTCEIRQFREPIKAAELMLEFPSFFLVNSQSLNIGRRFAPLNADEDLEFGNVYIMLPMKRLNSVVTAADVALLLIGANSAAKRIAGANVRISPEYEENRESPAAETSSRMSLEDVEGFPYRLSVCRSRKPTLETISEEPIRLR